MTHLLDIPDFLKRTPGDRPVTREPATRQWIMPKPRPKKKAKKTVGPSFEIRCCLRGLHWSDKVIDRLTSKQGDEIIMAGRYMMPADEVST
jgi:hypothetical protein